MSANSINDIKVDHFGSGIDYLATTSLGPCIGFVVLLDNNQHIFIEHRSSVYIPPLINLATVRLCFQNIAKHVSDLLPISSITSVWIFGGLSNDLNYNKTVKEINFLVESIKYFRLRAERVGAEEVKNDMAAQLMNDAKQLYKKTKADKKRQIELIPADKEIFEGLANKISCFSSNKCSQLQSQSL
ncbi:unnamed protein product [Rotaria sordida]|uniref:Uncharacterized protein n=2 Tax=Rotaria sordida TaxID=392033 RepID=A0A815C3G9_9BILA|nr:unnamed protein product [Rotaria sordida]CAF1281639.1 unnamed protein product [Rotaria sordida]